MTMQTVQTPPTASQGELRERSSGGMIGVPRPRRLAHWLGLAGVLGPLMYLLAFTVVGLARPGYSAVRQPVSELGIGPDGWQLNLPLILLGVLLIAFVAGFVPSIAGWSGKARRWVCAGLLALPGVGFAAAGVFPLPNPLHWLLGATLVFLGSVPAFFVTGALLRREPEWRGLGTYAVATGWLTLVLVIAMFAVANPSSPAASVQITGLIERVLFLEMLAWYAVAGWRLFQGSAG